jgi:hypothetical protein
MAIEKAPAGSRRRGLFNQLQKSKKGDQAKKEQKSKKGDKKRKKGTDLFYGINPWPPLPSLL